MRESLRLLSLVCTFILILAAPAPDGMASSGDRSVAASIASHLDDAAGEDRYTACVLLAELTATPGVLESLREARAAATGPVDAVCTAYALARLTQETGAIRRFIDAYPAGQPAAAIWKLHEQAGYPISLGPPPQAYLAELALTRDSALEALLRLLPHADGAHRQTLIDELAGLYQRRQRPLEAMADRLELDIERVRASASQGGNGDG